jgi:hypothetical protein
VGGSTLFGVVLNAMDPSKLSEGGGTAVITRAPMVSIAAQIEDKGARGFFLQTDLFINYGGTNDRWAGSL